MPNHLAPDGERERRNKPAELATIGASASAGAVSRQAPPLPFPMSPRLQIRWTGIWTSPLAAILDPVTDYAMMERLFWCYRMLNRLRRMLDKADEAKLLALLAGGAGYESDDVREIAAGIDRFNQTAAIAIRWAGEARQLETQLGLSPRARLGLGVMLQAAGGGTAGGGLDDFGLDA